MLVLHVVEVLASRHHIVEHVVQNSVVNIFPDCCDCLHKLIKVENSLFFIVLAAKGLNQSLTTFVKVLKD